MEKPRFITLEGIEGVGKSTHVEFLSACLVDKGFDVCVTREPGGTKLGEAVREILLHGDNLEINSEVELLLMFAARSQHISNVILPSLNKGEIVICDRFTDASYAYQGGGRGIDTDKIEIIEKWVQKDFAPDLTLLFDASVETGFSRLLKRGKKDRFEEEDRDFFEKIRKVYLQRAKAYPDRIKVIDAEKTIPEVQHQISILMESIF
jgi:dTMP kinase